MKRPTLATGLCAAVLGFASPAWAIDVVSRFDVGTEGWTLVGPGTLEWQATGGHEGGCLRITRTGTGELYLVAPSSFRGDWTAGSNDVYQFTRVTVDCYVPPGTPATRGMEYTVAGPAGSATTRSAFPDQYYVAGWRGISIRQSVPPVDPAVYREVTSLKIRVGMTNALAVGEVILVDTIGYKSCPQNCDGSTSSPILTANDFQCFMTAFARNEAYCNFDNYPPNNAEDFQAYLNAYAQGCSH